MKKYSDEIKTFIAENVKGMTAEALAELVNAKFGTAFTESKMRSFRRNHKLKSGIRKGVPAGLPTRLYPAEVQKFILDHYIGTGHQTMADLLNQTFGTGYTAKQMKAYYHNHKLDSGLKGFFKKGIIPFNKGKKGLSYPGMEATQFKKLMIPHNWVPVGTERINSDGYVDIKIQEGKAQKNWRGKHILVWETHHGRPVPPGHVVIFGDGNRHNFDPDNLLLVSKAQLVRMNQKHLIKNDIELTKVGMVIADIIMKCNEKKAKEVKRR